MIPSQNFGSFFSIDSDGMFTVDRFDQSFSYYKIFISVSNGMVRSDSEALGSFLTLSLQGTPISLPNVAPQFLEPVETLEVDL